MSWVKGASLWVRHGREKQGTIIVVRRKLGNAVNRNRLRRRLRSICLKNKEEIPPSLVIFCQPSATQTAFSELEQELKALLSKLAL
jgi:ribonuclease P protein component